MNKTQKQFKREMDKGLKELKKRNKESYYKYLMQNHLDNPKQRYIQGKNKKVKRFFGKVFKVIFNILIILIIISVAGLYLKEKTKDYKNVTIKDMTSITLNNNITANAKQQNILNYLNTIKPYQDKINADINSRNNDVSSFNKKLITQKQYIDNLIVYKNRINSNLIEMDKSSCPQELNNYKAMLKKQNQILYAAIDCEIQYMTSNDKASNNKAQEYFKQYNDLNKNISDEINGVLDRNGINHK